MHASCRPLKISKTSKSPFLRLRVKPALKAATAPRPLMVEDLEFEDLDLRGAPQLTQAVLDSFNMCEHEPVRNAFCNAVFARASLAPSLEELSEFVINSIAPSVTIIHPLINRAIGNVEVGVLTTASENLFYKEIDEALHSYEQEETAVVPVFARASLEAFVPAVIPVLDTVYFNSEGQLLEKWKPIYRLYNHDPAYFIWTPKPKPCYDSEEDYE